MDEENVPARVSAIECLDDNEVEPLTGKPFFHMIMCKSHLKTTLLIPTKLVELLPDKRSVPVILSHGSRSWYMKYGGNQYSQIRIYSGWKAFVEANMLTVGDVCLFELMSSDVTLIKFKVQILRGTLPSALLNREGETRDSPQVIEIE